jgi:hypothetical protein
MSSLVAVCVNWEIPRLVIFQRDVEYRHTRYDEYSEHDQIDMFARIIREFAQETVGFATRVIEEDKKQVAAGRNGRKRRYFGETRYDLYDETRPDLKEKCAKEVVPGLWIATNVGKDDKKRMLREACDAASVRWVPLRDMASQPRGASARLSAAPVRNVAELGTGNSA